MINSRYRIVRKLGEGGNGEVFLAEDTVRGAPVALKFLSDVHNVDDARKEFVLTSGLVHPFLVRTYDCAIVQSADDQRLTGRLFFSMEYVEAKDAQSFFGEMPHSARKVAFLEQFSLQMLAALYFIHDAGIVHLDVKPQNVFVCERDGGIAIKLGDFGFSASHADIAGAPAKGTPEYLSPEIAQGKNVDGRTDLWSLGVMLYQLVEGRCPFESASPVELLKRIIEEEVPKFKAALPSGSFLPGVIARLTSKDPERRPSSVSELLRHDFLPQHDALVMRSLFASHQSGYVGREGELILLESLLDDLSAANLTAHRGALIVGPEGIGKSRLLQEFQGCARKRNILCIALIGGPDDQPLAPLATAARLLEAELVSRGKPLSAEIIRAETSLRADRATPQDAYLRLFRRTSEKIPFLLVADDFHLFDEASRTVLTSLMNEPARSRFAVVLSITDEWEKELTTPPARMLRIDPEELALEDVTTLFRKVFGESFAATGIVTRLYQYYGGNPSLLMKAIVWIAESLPSEAILHPEACQAMIGELETLLTRNLDTYFSRRWRSLRKEKQIFLELLSCFDESPTMRMVARIVPFRPATLHAIVDALRKQRYLALDDDGDRPRIRHLALKEQLRSSAGGQQLHRSIAETLEGEAMSFGWKDLGELARQFELCGEPGKASYYFELAGDRASEDGESRAGAADVYTSALRCAGRVKGDGIVRVSSKLSDSYLADGAFQESIRVDELLLTAHTLAAPQIADAHKRLGKASSRLGNNVKALQHLETAIRHSTKEGDLFELQQEIVAIKIAEGFYDEAIRLSNAQRELAGRQADAQAIGVVETDLGIALFLSGEMDASLGAFTGALAVYERAKNKTKIVDALNNIGNVLSGMNSYRDALGKWNQAIGLIAEQGPSNQRAQILNNIGIAHAKLREFDEAASCYESARELFAGLDSKSGTAFTSTNLGEVAFAAGAYELALNRWSEALGLYEEMQDFTGVAQTLLAQAQIFIVLADWQRAGEALDKVADIQAHHAVPGSEALFDYLRGMQYCAAGRHADARNSFERAEKNFGAPGAFTGGILSEAEMRLYAGVRKAETHVKLNEPEQALRILRQLFADNEVERLRGAAAEINFAIATIEAAHPTIALDKPLVRLMCGLELIADEHVSEMTWKISYALGKEFFKRGQREKGRLHMRNAGQILDHFAAQFTDATLREQYLRADARGSIRAAIATDIDGRAT